MRRYSRTHLPAPHRSLFSVLQSPRPSTRFEVHPLLFLSPSPSPRVEPSTRQTRSVVLTRHRLANKIWLIAPERFLSGVTSLSPFLADDSSERNISRDEPPREISKLLLIGRSRLQTDIAMIGVQDGRIRASPWNFLKKKCIIIN